MKVALFLVCVLVLSVSAILPRSRTRPDNLIHNIRNYEERSFNIWKQKYNKKYEPEEEALRFVNFKNSLLRIESRNVKAENPVFGLTKFSDLTPTEFKNKYLGYVPSNRTRPATLLPRKNSEAAPPTAFDWRKQDRVTPVKDQGQCGSCWAFSVVENVESQYMIANNIGSADMPPLSPQQVVDCDSTDGGCNGGDPPTAYAYIMSAGGLETDADYPYTAEDGNCNFQQSDVKVTIANWHYATQTSNEAEMQTNLVAWGPLSICVDASSWQDYTGGIMAASDCGNNIDHCVDAVGYDLTNAAAPFWSVRNSWGTDWGENGYIRLQYGQDTCSLADEATSSCISGC